MANITQKFLLLLLFACSSVLLHAQARLAIDSARTIPADTVQWNGGTYLLRYEMTVTNVGNNTLNGGVDILCRNNETSLTWKVAEFEAVNFEVGSTQFISYYDTIPALTPGNRYKGGDNIIVIWPKAENPNVQNPDSAFLDVYIKVLPTSTNDPIELQNRIAVYPNPVGENLYLDYQRDAHKLEYVRVVNLAGQVMQQQEAAVSRLDFSGLPAGLYMLEVRYRDGVWGSFRILHEK
jgi:Secretion system C-terminal sorting domain